MKALVITSRFPWPSYTGERLRASIWLSALARSGEVALVAPGGTLPGDLPPFRFFAARRSVKGLVQGALLLVRDGLPLQCLLAAPYDWHAAISRARQDAGPFDVTVVILSRMHPWVEKTLEGRTVLDAVDSLRRSAEERANAAAPPMRWFWRIEERRMAHLERDAARAYGQIVVVSEDERGDFGEAAAVPVSIATKALDSMPRRYDFGFWGRLAYFANADAAAWLLGEIWPAIRALNPAATLILGGADAPQSLRKAARRSGVTLISPVGDMAAFARDIRVALMPLRYGSGQSGKVLEAAEGGCAIVGTPQAFRGLAPLALHARIESSASGFAHAAADLLADEDSRATQVTGLRDVVAGTYARSVTLDRLSAIAAGTEAG
ncbi:MAG TPA: glycosyltransferase family 4 protein [Thermoanaerobaculia bacterium]|nr:glycosyltransferase family 4 protein [Thermoanaerobaculia bacterium]